MDIKISCIIPVYNSEQYLQVTLQSLIDQTFKEIEIICINDASKDDSIKILEEFRQKDSRFKIINNSENKGAAISRNIGLNFAKGEYVIFLDSDDFYYENMLEQTYSMARQYQSDLVIFGYEHINLKSDKDRRETKEYFVNHFQILQKGQRENEYIRMIGHGAWNKLIKKDMLVCYNIRFQNIESNNDLYFSMAVGLAADKTVICDKVLMSYYMGRNGSITQFRRKKRNCRVLAFIHLLEFLEKIEIEKNIENELYNYMIGALESDFEDRNNSLECRENIEKQIYESAYFCQKLEKAYVEGVLYPHARIFAEKIFNREDIKESRFYEYYIPEIKKLLEDNKKASKRVALWGCGKIGKRIIDGANAAGIVFDYLIDMDEKKQSTTYGGYVINQYDKLKDDIDIILVTVLKPQYYEEIKKLAIGKEVLNICTMR